MHPCRAAPSGAFAGALGLACSGANGSDFAGNALQARSSWPPKAALRPTTEEPPGLERWAPPTTYTFIVRHEPASASSAPGVALPAAPREVLLVHGGAPLTSEDYGFGLFSQRADGAIVVDEI